MSNNHGRFFWYELMAPDTAAAVAFYTKVVGWTAREAGPQYGGYTVLQTSQAEDSGTAGVMALTAEMKAAAMRPGWLGYIFVDDVDASAEQIAKLGGKVHRPPTDIPDIGRFCPVSDPQGAGFLIMKPNGPTPETPPPPPPRDKPGHVGWRELMAGDWKTVWPFYEQAFGWKKLDEHDMGPMGTYLLIEMAGQRAGGMMTKPAEQPQPSWNYYIQVESTGAAFQRAKDLGATFFHGPTAVPTGEAWIAQGMDPQGAAFNLISANP